MARTDVPVLPAGATRIFRVAGGGASALPEEEGSRREEMAGYLDGEGAIYRLRWGEGRLVGRTERVGDERRIVRYTTHGERELGLVLPTGAIRSAGLFEGGELGWMEPDGVVLQGGFILGEEEVGRVEGPLALEAAAALLLLFLPDEAEDDRRAARGT
jgi:hypothetical protein